MKTYADAAVWAKLPNPPTELELKPAFKQAYKESLLERPCFGGTMGQSSRQWWTPTVTRALELCGRTYSDDEFERFFRRVYQHYGSLAGYEKLADAEALLEWLAEERPDVLLGVTTNTPVRTIETVLPMNGYHDYFKWFTCSQDVGVEKPGEAIFSKSFDQARFWMPDLEKHQVLHLGDSLAADLCGARAFGFQSLLVDRSSNPKVSQYQDWLDAPDYPGKSESDIAEGTVRDMIAVMDLLKAQA